MGSPLFAANFGPMAAGRTAEIPLSPTNHLSTAANYPDAEVRVFQIKFPDHSNIKFHVANSYFLRKISGNDLVALWQLGMQPDFAMAKCN
jgi:hypothetical protein